MQSESQPKPLKELAKAYQDKDLKVNPEYQRGTKWKTPQRQALLDSILRGFSLPLFYVHLEEIKNTFTDSIRTTAWIVDGQQRLAAITDFINDGFALADPRNITSGAILPYQVNDIPVWAGKKFSQLNDEDRERLLRHELMVICMREDRPNEVRDLFIRLQSGTPLTAQEKRDAWPGNFSNFVIKYAGKPGHPASNPHKFFDYIKIGGKSVLKIDDEDHYIDKRANARKFFAGLVMTIIIRESTGHDFVDLKGKNINDFYLRSADLEATSKEARRVINVLDTICALPHIESFSVSANKLSYQSAFHFAILVDTFFQGNYVEGSWKDKIVNAFEDFRAKEADSRVAYKKDKVELPHYRQFVRKLSGSGSETSSVIRQRHSFLLSEILSKLTPIPKDPQRLFGGAERESIWYRDGGKCKHPECGVSVPLYDARIHHIHEHTEGGQTVLDNGILICASCHSDRKDMQNLREYFEDYISSTKSHNNSSEDSDEDSDSPNDLTRGKISIDINWSELGVSKPLETIKENNDSNTVVKFCEVLISHFGADMETNLTSVPVIRFPLSVNPEIDFVNENSGKVYPNTKIPGTDLYVCTHSDTPQKIKKLRELVTTLFPEKLDAIRISLS